MFGLFKKEKEEKEENNTITFEEFKETLCKEYEEYIFKHTPPNNLPEDYLDDTKYKEETLTFSFLIDYKRRPPHIVINALDDFYPNDIKQGIVVNYGKLKIEQFLNGQLTNSKIGIYFEVRVIRELEREERLEILLRKLLSKLENN